MRLNGSVHCEGVQRIHRGIVYCADDPGGTDDVPRCVVCLAPRLIKNVKGLPATHPRANMESMTFESSLLS
jgi:hypothetical protein